MRLFNKKAFSILEYAALIIIVGGGLVIMKSYMQRGVYGNWVQSGQSYAFGRQYDSPKSIDCAFDPTSNQWYDRNCLRSLSSKDNCPLSNYTCVESIIASGDCSGNSGTYCVHLNQ